MRCPRGHTFNPADRGILNSDTNSKQSEKKEALEIICWILTKNSGGSLSHHHWHYQKTCDFINNRCVRTNCYVFNYTSSLRNVDIFNYLRVVNIISKHGCNMLTFREALIFIISISLTLKHQALALTNVLKAKSILNITSKASSMVSGS